MLPHAFRASFLTRCSILERLTNLGYEEDLKRLEYPQNLKYMTELTRTQPLTERGPRCFDPFTHSLIITNNLKSRILSVEKALGRIFTDVVTRAIDMDQLNVWFACMHIRCLELKKHSDTGYWAKMFKWRDAVSVSIPLPLGSSNIQKGRSISQQ
jgi:hypothetical protein